MGTKKVRVLIAKPGLDGHDVGAKIVVRALIDAGCEVIYTGLKKTAADIASTARDEDVDVIGLSILSGSHLPLCRDLKGLLDKYGIADKLWIVGGNIFHEKTTTLGYYDNTMAEKSMWDQPDRSADAWSVFGQATYSFTDQWHLTLGWRHSDETKEDVGGRTWTCSSGNGCAPEWAQRAYLNSLPADMWFDKSIYPEYSENDNKGSWDHDDWRVGLDWDVSPNTLIYTYLATGFKSGGIGDVFHEVDPYTGEEINVRTSFGPEEVMTWEIGAKTTLFDGTLKLQATYFYSDYEDMQYASVGSIATTHRWEAQRDENDQPI